MSEHWGGYDPGDGPLRDDIDELTEKIAERDAEIEWLRNETHIDLDWNRLRSGDYRALNPEHQDVFDMAAAKDAEIERLRGLLRELFEELPADCAYEVSPDIRMRVREALGE